MASATDNLQVTILSEDGWAEMMADMKAEGERLAQEKRDQGETFMVKALGSTMVRGGDKVPLSGANFPVDWKCATRGEMAELAKELITKSYLLGALDPALPTVLGSVIGGKSLYEYSIGELFQLYGQFMGKYGLPDGKATRGKMEMLINGNQQYLKLYQTTSGQQYNNPLPYTVRQILAHPDTVVNTLDDGGNDLRTAIELLRQWVSQ